MGRRRTARELALKWLFQCQVGGTDPDALLASFDTARYARETIDFAHTLLRGAWAHRKELDAIVRDCSHGWPPDRMARVDLMLLRVALFEIFHLPDIPPSVTADEAVELAKKYSTAESGRFINGILGNVIRRLPAARTQASDGA